jgi:Flp pilus assembly protein TadD
LSELLVEVAGKPVQVEVSAVRVLFELLGFLLSRVLHISWPTSAKIKIKNQEQIVWPGPFEQVELDPSTIAGQSPPRGGFSVGSLSLRGAILLLVLASGLAGFANADEHCHVATAHDTLPADKAYLAGKLGEAEGLYREAVSQSPHDAELDAGLVRTLLRERKLDDAISTAQAAVAAKPNSVPLLTVLAEVQYRQGKVAEAAGTADQAFRADRCYGRLYLLRGRILRLNSMYASANRAIGIAHQLDPWDAEIRGAWVQTLPLETRIEEQKQYLAAATGIEPEDKTRAEKYLKYLEAEAANPGKNCHMASTATSTELQLIPLRSFESGGRFQGWGLHVFFNGREGQLEVDSGASGLVIGRATADRAGLKPDERIQIGGVGDQGRQGGYTAKVGSIKVGGLEFRDCMVEVTDRKEVVGIDGLIGTDVFSSYLVTLDYPMRKFSLAPLPPRPGDDSAPVLNTEAASQGAGTSAGAAQSAGPQDRYISPDMKDYVPFFRAGHFVIIPVTLNHKTERLFMVDSGAFSSSISPEAAAAVTKVHGSPVTIMGMSGAVKKVSESDHIVFDFGGIQQTNNNLFAFDTATMTRFAGLEVSGFLGYTILRELATHIDYRDGLIKFDYDPKHGVR